MNLTLTAFHASILFSSAVVASALNGIAGGGSFVSFPALIFTGIPPIAANATNNAALILGTFGSVSVYRQELSNQRGGIAHPWRGQYSRRNSWLPTIALYSAATFYQIDSLSIVDSFSLIYF